MAILQKTLMAAHDLSLSKSCATMSGPERPELAGTLRIGSNRSINT